MMHPIYVIPFIVKNRMYLEVDERIVRAGEIVAGEPLQLELVGLDIVYRRKSSLLLELQQIRRTASHGQHENSRAEVGDSL